jgi:hypothetical protein
MILLLLTTLRLLPDGVLQAGPQTARRLAAASPDRNYESDRNCQPCCPFRPSPSTSVLVVRFSRSTVRSLAAGTVRAIGRKEELGWSRRTILPARSVYGGDRRGSEEVAERQEGHQRPEHAADEALGLGPRDVHPLATLTDFLEHRARELRWQFRVREVAFSPGCLPYPRRGSGDLNPM